MDNKENICFLLLIFLFIFSLIFPGGGVTYHIKAFKAFCAMLVSGLIIIIFLLYLPKLKCIIISKAIIFFILYIASLHFPLLYKTRGYDTGYYLALYVIGLLLFILAPTGFHYLFSKSVTTRKRFFLVFSEYLTYVLLFISLLGIAEYFKVYFTTPSPELSVGVKITFGNPNYLGNFLVLSLPLVLAFGFMTKTRFKRILSIITITLMLFCGGLSSSRITFAIVLVTIPLFLLAYFIIFIRCEQRFYGFFKNHFIKIILGGCLFCILIFSTLFFNQILFYKLSNLLNPSTIFKSRYPSFLTAWRLWTLRPIEFFFGYGSGAFYSLIFSHYPPNFRKLGQSFRGFKHVHNELLEILVEGGNLAGILFGIFLFLIFFALYKSIKEDNESKEARIFAFGLFGAIFCHLIFGFFSLAPKMPSSLFFFYLIIAFSLIYSTHFKISLTPIKKIIFMLLILILFSYPSIVLTRNFLSEHYHFKAKDYDINAIVKGEYYIRQQMDSFPSNEKLMKGLEKAIRYRKKYEKHLKKALLYNPKNIYALYTLLYYNSIAFNKQEFFHTFERISSIIPHYVDIDYLRSRFHVLHGERSFALQWLETYLKQDIFFEEGYIDRVIILLLEQRYIEMEQALTKIIDNDLKEMKRNNNWALKHEYIFGENQAGKYVEIRNINETGDRKKFGCYYSDFFKGVKINFLGFDDLKNILYRCLGLFYRELDLPFSAYKKYLLKVSDQDIKKLIIEYYQNEYQKLQYNIKEKGENRKNLLELLRFLKEYKTIFRLSDKKSFSVLRDLNPQLESVLSSKHSFFQKLSSVFRKLKDYRSAEYYKQIAYLNLDNY